jgi:cobalt-zinc-cadmium efflux system outer membrane protein
MIKRFLIIAYIFAKIPLMYAQDVSGFLKQVSENNPEILAFQKLLEAKKFEARTGLAPSDPFVSFGYMPGNTADIGTKKIWSVNQSFSFPTKYLLQRKISRGNIILAEQEFNLGKLMTLLDAKLTLYDLIYNEKTLNVLILRRMSYDSLKTAWKKMVDYGEATILEYNKIMMELSSLNLDITRTEADISILKNKLLFMSGNSIAIPVALNYPLIKEPDEDNLITEKIASHPAFIIPEKEYLVSCEEVKLSRTNGLPEFQVGYSSEIVPGQTYSGPVAGLTIPLWANSNRVKTSSALAEHSAAVRDAGLLRLKSEVSNEFSNMKALKKSIMEISGILESGNNKKYLDLALTNGEISLTTYFSNLGVMFQVEDRLLKLESEYNKSLARLLDNELLK